MTLAWRYILCRLLVMQSVLASRAPMMAALGNGIAGHDNMISLSLDWEVLGPFQIGTREATWGADPLESQGGFRALGYDPNSEFRSSLAPDGIVGWSLYRLEKVESEANASKGSLTVSFPTVDWSFLQFVYGWAALQFQAWARGTISINADHAKPVLLYLENVLEFWVDGRSYFGGDFYSYRRAPLVLYLEPGQHRLDIRLIRDARVMGATGEASIRIGIEAIVSHSDLKAVESKLLVPDLVDGKLSSHLASIPLRNEGSNWIQILGAETVDNLFLISMLEKSPLSLAPGQTRPLAFEISMLDPMAELLSLRFKYIVGHDRVERLTSVISFRLSRRSIIEPHKLTFLHNSGIVSYAILRAPSNITCLHTCPKELPILLNLHGAGLEADSDQVRHSLDILPGLCSWVLFPTGVTPWSGDDWHNWGFADVEAAIAAIPRWIEAIGWKGPSANTERWLFSGHSNGGQGTWYALTHRPDKIIAAAPVSGYSSIQTYVPYQFWHEADPLITSVLQASMNSYRHELLVDNFNGIPVLQQHGSADDNVPVYHSRHMNQLISVSTGSSKYVELSGVGHWFDGVMTTMPLREFYEHWLDRKQAALELPMRFTIIIANPRDMGSRASIVVDQLVSPGQFGRIHVERFPLSTSWVLRTSNILRFHFIRHCGFRLRIDNTPEFEVCEQKREDWGDFTRLKNGSWQRSDITNWPTVEERHGRQLGSLNAILNSQDRLSIVTNGDDTYQVALQITRNLFQYYAADSSIVNQSSVDSDSTGNFINVLFGPDPPLPRLNNHPISVEYGVGISVRDISGDKLLYAFEEGLGAIFLRPLPGERLELVVWGLDDIGLRQAARLVPMLTGVGQADFVIVSKRCLWSGAKGVLATGFLDHFWNVTRASYLT